jgi:hypothetical protein
MRTYTDEALELQKHGYFRLLYLELNCRDHGTVRLGIEPQPLAENIPCPFCERVCECRLIGRGFTQRSLPLIEVVCEPIRLANQLPSYLLHLRKQREARVTRRLERNQKEEHQVV